jgi:uncharacterized membrane protein YqjE
METNTSEAPRRGVLGNLKDYVINVLGATRTRVEIFSAEVEHRVFRLLWMLIWIAAATMSLTFALIFGMLTVMFGLHLPPLYAFGIPMAVFLLVGLVSVVMFQKAKHSKRPADPE